MAASRKKRMSRRRRLWPSHANGGAAADDEGGHASMPRAASAPAELSEASKERVADGELCQRAVDLIVRVELHLHELTHLVRP